MHDWVARMRGVMMGGRVAARGAVALHRAAVMGGGPVTGRNSVMRRRSGISPRRWRGRRNVGRRQLGFRLSLRGIGLIGGRGLLRPKRRRDQKCGTGQRDTQHDSPPRPLL